MSRALLLLAAVAAFLAVIWVRIAPSDAARWHVDPETATRAKRPNDFTVLPGSGDLSAPVYALEARELAARFQDVALGEARTSVLAGAPAGDGALVTYIQRSALVGFPDYITVKFMARGEATSTLAIWSRSRFGYSDRGVNARRVRRWLKALEAFEQSG